VLVFFKICQTNEYGNLVTAVIVVVIITDTQSCTFNSLFSGTTQILDAGVLLNGVIYIVSELLETSSLE